MKFINNLEKKIGHWAIPNLTLHIIIAQFIFWVLVIGRMLSTRDLVLFGGQVMSGQLWRCVSFMCIPPYIAIGGLQIFFLIISWYVFYTLGSALEGAWGSFKYNLYIYISWFMTVIASICIYLIFGNNLVFATNSYILLSVFYAFAYLFPDFEFLMFFFLPVKVKWLALFSLGMIFIEPKFYPGPEWMLIFAGLSNFIIFFAKDIKDSFKAKKKKKEFIKQTKLDATKPRHQCFECGINDKEDKTIEFRYCSKCEECFCLDHISKHNCQKK